MELELEVDGRRVTRVGAKADTADVEAVVIPREDRDAGRRVWFFEASRARRPMDVEITADGEQGIGRRDPERAVIVHVRPRAGRVDPIQPNQIAPASNSIRPVASAASSSSAVTGGGVGWKGLADPLAMVSSPSLSSAPAMNRQSLYADAT